MPHTIHDSQEEQGGPPFQWTDYIKPDSFEDSGETVEKVTSGILQDVIETSSQPTTIIAVEVSTSDETTMQTITSTIFENITDITTLPTKTLIEDASSNATIVAASNNATSFMDTNNSTILTEMMNSTKTTLFEMADNSNTGRDANNTLFQTVTETAKTESTSLIATSITDTVSHITSLTENPNSLEKEGGGGNLDNQILFIILGVILGLVVLVVIGAFIYKKCKLRKGSNSGVYCVAKDNSLRCNV